MKKILVRLSALFFCFVPLSSVVGCNQKKHFVIDGDYVVITADSSKVAADSTLKEYMDYMQEREVFSFVWESGMLVSINGKENGANFNPCWILYTNDTENANSAWGTCEYDGETYFSAIAGADSLQIKDGYVYIWYLQDF